MKRCNHKTRYALRPMTFYAATPPEVRDVAVSVCLCGRWFGVDADSVTIMVITEIDAAEAAADIADGVVGIGELEPEVARGWNDRAADLADYREYDRLDFATVGWLAHAIATHDQEHAGWDRPDFGASHQTGSPDAAAYLDPGEATPHDKLDTSDCEEPSNG